MGIPSGFAGSGLFAAVAACWRRVSDSERPFEPEYLALQEAARAAQRLITCEPNDIHAHLLARRMELLQRTRPYRSGPVPGIAGDLPAVRAARQLRPRAARRQLGKTGATIARTARG